MSDSPTPLQGEDFAAGVALDRIAEGSMLLGHAHGEALLLSRHGGELFAVGATCTHYGGPLAEGTVMETCVMCPRHGACFDLKTGHGTFPAAGPIPIYEARIEGDEIKIRL